MRHTQPANRVLLAVQLAAALTLLVTDGPAASPPAAGPELSIEGDSQAGHATISWKSSERHARTFELEQSTTSGFEQPRLIYRGPHTATVISGLPSGETYYRLRQGVGRAFGEWSTVESFRVEHPTMGRAMLLFGLGAFVFVATALVIVRGSRQPNRTAG